MAGEAGHPVDGRIVAGVRQFLGQGPEGLDDVLGVTGHRLGEVSARGRDGADQGDGAGTGAPGLDPAGALIDRRQARGQVGRIALLDRHLPQAARDLTQGLRPAAGGVRQHDHVITHVAVVLGHGDADVDRGLPRHHRHVGGIGHQQGALHELAPGVGVVKLGEGLQHVHQLVAALAATDVDDDVGVGPARHLLLHHRLAGAEGARYRPLAALELGEEGIDDPLARNQRRHAIVAPQVGARLAHRPAVEELEAMGVTLGIAQPADGRLQVIVAGGGELVELAAQGRRHQDAMDDGLGFLDRAQDRTRTDPGAGLQLTVGLELPHLGPVQGRHVQAAADIVPGLEGDLLQGALDAVEDAPEQARAQFHRQGPAKADGGLAGAHPLGGLVGLDDGLVAAQGDDLAEQAQLADAHLLAVADARQDDGDDGAVDVADPALARGVTGGSAGGVAAGILGVADASAHDVSRRKGCRCPGHLAAAAPG